MSEENNVQTPEPGDEEDLSTPLNNMRLNGGAQRYDNRHTPRSSIVKLRLDNVPRWPKPGYKFYQWQYDWEASMALMGIREIIKAPVDDPDVTAADDALCARYLVASISNTHVSAYLASNFAGKGREAYEWLDSEYGLCTMRQSDLRAELDEKQTLKPHSDPRLIVILFEKLANRLTPPPSDQEKSEILLGKISTALPDVCTLISATTDVADFNAIKNKFVKLIRDRQRDQRKLAQSDTDVFASIDEDEKPQQSARPQHPLSKFCQN